MVSLLFNGQLTLGSKLLKTSHELYRASFISTALSEGIYDILRDGPVDIERLCDELEPGLSREGMEAWLNLGVSLGELKLGPQGYSIKGSLSKKLILPENDPYRAVLEEIAIHHYNYVVRTPSILKKKELFTYDEADGELIARSSRVSEPVIMEVVEDSVPRSGPFKLLEVGCGSGVYIKRACERNPSLRALGLELDPQVAEFARNNIKSWGFEDRVTIEASDVREYRGESQFDLATLHQNIYYFKVDERAELARGLIELIKPGGHLLLTTACQGGGPVLQAINIWVTVTEGYDALPYPDQLCEQLNAAGFSKVQKKKLIPYDSFWAFIAQKPM